MCERAGAGTEAVRTLYHTLYYGANAQSRKLKGRSNVTLRTEYPAHQKHRRGADMYNRCICVTRRWRSKVPARSGANVHNMGRLNARALPPSTTSVEGFFGVVWKEHV